MINEIELLKKLVSIRSEPSKSNKEIIMFISELFKVYPQRMLQQEKNGLELFNLIITIPIKEGIKKNKESFKPIIFCMHSDTVEGEWFGEVLETNRDIIGLGSCDMKAGIASVCSAVLEADTNREIYLVFSSDEETSGKGARLISEKLDVNNAIIIVPEPTSRKVNNSQNSCLSFEITVEGIRQHASISTDFNNKNNAIIKMVRICKYLIDYPRTDSDLTSQNIGFINGGITSNMVADKCVMKFEQRFLPGTNVNNKIWDMTLALQKLGASSVKLRFFGEDFSNNNKDIEKKVGEIVSKYFVPKFEKFKAWSEAGIFCDKGECMIFGPGDSNLAHTKNESVEKKEVTIFKDIYSDFIRELN